MRYTRSKDGVERATLRVEVRLTRDEVTWLRERAKASGVYSSPHDLLRGLLSDALWREREQAEEETR